MTTKTKSDKPLTEVQGFILERIFKAFFLDNKTTLEEHHVGSFTFLKTKAFTHLGTCEMLPKSTFTALKTKQLFVVIRNTNSLSEYKLSSIGLSVCEKLYGSVKNNWLDTIETTSPMIPTYLANKVREYLGNNAHTMLPANMRILANMVEQLEKPNDNPTFIDFINNEDNWQWPIEQSILLDAKKDWQAANE